MKNLIIIILLIIAVLIFVKMVLGNSSNTDSEGEISISPTNGVKISFRKHSKEKKDCDHKEEEEEISTHK